jgi:hypothetical protein
MAGLVVTKEFFKWTNGDNADCLSAGLLIQHELSIVREAEISHAACSRYQKLFRFSLSGCAFQRFHMLPAMTSGSLRARRLFLIPAI